MGSRNDFEEIHRHDFFSSIDWDDLNARRIQPPFKPNVRGLTDTGNIDPEFTREIVSRKLFCYFSLKTTFFGRILLSKYWICFMLTQRTEMVEFSFL